MRGAGPVSGLGDQPDSNLATYLTTTNGVSNVIHELRHDFAILVASRVTRALDTIRYVLEFAFDSFQSAGKDSVEDWVKRGWNNERE